VAGKVKTWVWVLVGIIAVCILGVIAMAAASSRRLMTPMSGRYMRRSAPTSVTIGTRLEAGASVTQNQTPQNPSCGRRAKATSANARPHRIVRHLNTACYRIFSNGRLSGSHRARPS